MWKQGFKTRYFIEALFIIILTLVLQNEGTLAVQAYKPGNELGEGGFIWQQFAFFTESDREDINRTKTHYNSVVDKLFPLG